MEVNLSFIKTKKSPFPFPTMRKDLPRSNVIANLPKHVGTTNSLCGDQIQCGKMALVQGCLHFFSLGATFKMTNGAFPLQSGARFKRAVTSASVKVIYLQGRPCPKSCGEALCVASGGGDSGLRAPERRRNCGVLTLIVLHLRFRYPFFSRIV